MRFDYYARLSTRQKATYRKSDNVARVEVPDPESLRPLLETMQRTLEADDRGALGRATSALANELLRRWKVPPVVLRVLARRPSDENAELHGLYVREEDKTPVIRLWMRTAAQVKPVKFRTFLRTFAHELLHHLDFELLQLEDTFHTEGFFRRESDLVKQLLGEPRNTPRPEPEVPAEEKAASRRRGSSQLSLFTPEKKRT